MEAAACQQVSGQLRENVTLDIPFVFSSNGDGFVFHDRTGTYPEKEASLGLDSFPSPTELWATYREWKGLTPEAEQIVLQDYFDDGSGRAPRYYQCNAVNAAIEAIAKGQNRHSARSWPPAQARPTPQVRSISAPLKAGRKKRILFLADRNVLVDQTMVNDFRPFGAAMAKLSTGSKTIERADGSEVQLPAALDKAPQRHRLRSLSSHQQPSPARRTVRNSFASSRPAFLTSSSSTSVTGGAPPMTLPGAKSSAISPARPKSASPPPRQKPNTRPSNIHYFGKAVYSYSLKQGIRDGFLAPYKVIKVHIDVDVEGYRPQKGQTDRDGNEIDDRTHTTLEDFRTAPLSTPVPRLLPKKSPIF